MQKEELDPGFSLSFGPILESKILVDSDHAHDLMSHQFLIGILSFVSSSLVTWSNQRQESFSSSTNDIESSALRTTT